MKSLYLHVEHGKTGSSFIQASLKASRELLLENGYEYPLTERKIEGTQVERTSQGNFPPEKGRQGYGHTVNSLNALLENTTKDKIIISNEGLFWSILREKFLEDLTKEFGANRIKLRLYIRDHLLTRFQHTKSFLRNAFTMIFTISCWTIACHST